MQRHRERQALGRGAGLRVERGRAGVVGAARGGVKRDARLHYVEAIVEVERAEARAVLWRVDDRDVARREAEALARLFEEVLFPLVQVGRVQPAEQIVRLLKGEALVRMRQARHQATDVWPVRHAAEARAVECQSRLVSPAERGRG